MEAYAGIDLHSSNNFLGIINQEDERIYQKRLPNSLEHVLAELAPFMGYSVLYCQNRKIPH